MNKIDLCKKCEKRKFEKTFGIICGLTNEKPTFVDDCPHFIKDATIKVNRESSLRPNEIRAKTALLLIWIVLIIEILSLVSSAFQYNLLQMISKGGEISNEVATSNDIREQAIAVIYLIAYLISGITFIMWFRRAYYNLHIKVKTLSFTEGWAAGSWFVPIVNLYRPFQIMKELYVETKKYVEKNNVAWQTDLTAKHLWIWWTLWVVNGILGQIEYRLTTDSNTLSELLNLTQLSMVSSLVGLLLGVVTLKVIHDYSKVEGMLQ